MAQTPILIIGDAVSAPTGLGRIARELALRADSQLRDVCRIATLGYGGPGSRKFNFPQYAIQDMGNDFVIPNLPEVWDDWARNEPGVVLFIWDATRLGWFSRPRNPELSLHPYLRRFLAEAKFQRWIYAPLDGGGPHDRLSYAMTQSLLGFDRILAYGSWGEGLIRASLGEEAAAGRDLHSVPHGLDSNVFFPRHRVNSRMNFFRLTGGGSLRGTQTAILEDQPLIGTVATNQARKDWALWAAACALFLVRHPQARFWIHIDKVERYWSIPSLLIDFGLMDRTIISFDHLDDNTMAQAYSACDLTLGIGPEGFGFPIWESIFCGTPCITGNYGGAPEHFQSLPGHEHLLIDPVAFRFEGLYAVRRPVYAPHEWAHKMETALGMRVDKPEHLDWENIWPRFEAWFRRGLGISRGTMSTSEK